MLVGLRYVHLYAILKDYLSALLDFKGTLRALHPLRWVWDGLPGTESLILRSKGYEHTTIVSHSALNHDSNDLSCPDGGSVSLSLAQGFAGAIFASC
jgi:hypothetical protein